MIDMEGYYKFKELLNLKHSPLTIFYTDKEPKEGNCPPPRATLHSRFWRIISPEKK